MNLLKQLQQKTDYWDRPIRLEHNCIYLRRIKTGIELRPAYIVTESNHMVKIRYKFNKKARERYVMSSSLIMLTDEGFDIPDGIN